MKNGRYRYKYVNNFGEKKYVYSWRLDVHDPQQADKPIEASLREKEKQIQADMFDQITPEGGKLTILALVERYVSLKNNVRPSTEASYRTVMNILKKDPFGSKRIDKVKLSFMYIKLLKQ